MTFLFLFVTLKIALLRAYGNSKPMKRFLKKIKALGGEKEVDAIDVHDLPEAEAAIVAEFVEFLRTKLKMKRMIKEEPQGEKEWSELAVSSFASDWENEKDAVYDNWRRHYHVPER